MIQGFQAQYHQIKPLQVWCYIKTWQSKEILQQSIWHILRDNENLSVPENIIKKSINKQTGFTCIL